MPRNLLTPVGAYGMIDERLRQGRLMRTVHCTGALNPSEANQSPPGSSWEHGETFLEQPHIVMRVYDAQLTSVVRIVTTASILP